MTATPLDSSLGQMYSLFRVHLVSGHGARVVPMVENQANPSEKWGMSTGTSISAHADARARDGVVQRMREGKAQIEGVYKRRSPGRGTMT
jgi:hypothetical protein